MRGISLLVVALLLPACASVAAGNPNVAASVDGADIPITEVEEQYDQALGQPEFAARVQEEPEFGPQVQAQILTQLIQVELLEAWASDLGVEATDEEIEAEREEVIEQLGGQEAFDAAIEQNGLTDEQVDEQLRQRVLQDKITEEVAAAPVTDEEIAQFYEENRDARYGGTATARHILVEDRETAERLRRRLDEGDDFGELAREFSTDTGSGAEGGRLPAYARGQTAPEFDEVLFNAPLNELVGPVQTQFGFHLVEVLERSGPRPLTAVEDDIRAELEETRQQETLQEELRARTQAADVQVNPRFGQWNAETGQVDPVPALGATSEAADPNANPSEPLVVPDPGQAPADPGQAPQGTEAPVPTPTG